MLTATWDKTEIQVIRSKQKDFQAPITADSSGDMSSPTMDIILYQYILQHDLEPLQDMLLGDWTQNTLRAMQGLAGTEGCHYFNGGLTTDVAGSSPFMLYQSFLDFL